jgi:SAM-dependent MidA family methyltransferase
MEQALYGPSGFYRAGAGPAAHFRTSAHVSPLFAAALARLARSAGLDTVVDVGAGRGELLGALRACDPSLRLCAVEVAGRPAELGEVPAEVPAELPAESPVPPADVEWSATLPTGLTALLVANEWLDNVPCDVVEVDEHGCARVVQVDADTGAERLAEPVDGESAAWLRRWWPLDGAAPGDRAEVGLARDAAWAAAVASLAAGVAVAIDYGHERAARPAYGTLCGYRYGRVVAPVPDGSCDLTAHVALDACAAAGKRAGAAATLLTTQRAALRALGVDGSRPPYELAQTDPQAYLQALSSAGEAAELLDPSGLGGFQWLVQARGGWPIPQPLATLRT